MATFKKFEDISAWQDARRLTAAVYRVSSVGGFARDYPLRDQMRRACISIMSNIAEGFERSSPASFHHFLSIAKGSAGEVRSQLYVAYDEAYIDQATFDDLYQQTTSIIKQVAGLMHYLRRHRAAKS
ncbi:MAG: four helix bundle protein [Bacteroidetes bacterium]|jgi:four helix bundle protein|nr:four helix bundle protein [Bacteroidota bacterium]